MSSVKETSPFLYVGGIVHSLSPQNLKIIDDGIIVVDGKKIVLIQETSTDLENIKTKFNVLNENVEKLEKGQFLIPGFIDTHIHAPQYPNAGLGYDLPLLDWLAAYTFPLEKKYKDEKFAQKVYEAVAKRTLDNGTTTSCYFATIHKNSSVLLAKCVENVGQRAFIGKVNMNRNLDSDYVETTEESYGETISFIEEVLALKNDLVKPIITPRFALSCDMNLMKSLAELAKKYDIPIQTHISENKTEVEIVGQEFPDCKNYLDVYDVAGLITEKTILAHGIYLKDEELAVLKAKGASVSTCPNSNLNLRSGNCPVRKFLNYGVKVSLGTDCAGGYSVSLLDSIRLCLQSSIQASFQGIGEPLSIPEVFYLATLGGAEALSLSSVTGNFELGKEFDAILVNLNNNAAIDLLEEYNLDQLFQKFIYLGDDRMISKVYVAGKKVKGNLN